MATMVMVSSGGDLCNLCESSTMRFDPVSRMDIKIYATFVDRCPGRVIFLWYRFWRAFFSRQNQPTISWGILHCVVLGLYAAVSYAMGE
jgi:hypothetical protein